MKSKKNTISKKINTIPHGEIIIILLLFCIILTMIMGLILVPKSEAIAMFAVAVVFFVMVIKCFSCNYLNYIELDEKGVYHGKDFISWENVYMTVKCDNPNFMRNSFEYYIFFGDHFFNKQEMDSKKRRENGFYFMLTYKRTLELIPFCRTEIRMLNDISYSRRQENMIALIKEHNSKIRASK